MRDITATIGTVPPGTVVLAPVLFPPFNITNLYGTVTYLGDDLYETEVAQSIPLSVSARRTWTA
jgi:hypothetical protein